LALRSVFMTKKIIEKLPQNYLFYNILFFKFYFKSNKHFNKKKEKKI